jgi:hypothetical protein
MYHATLPDGYNNETVHLMESSPRLQIIIATVAITHGINIKGIQDCLATHVPKTLNSVWQFMGRGGHQDKSMARGVFFATKAEIKAVKKCSKSTLTKAESAAVYPKVLEFHNSICRTLSFDPQFVHYPITAFFLEPLIDTLLSKLLLISSFSALESLVSTHTILTTTHIQELFVILWSEGLNIKQKRGKAKASRNKKKADKEDQGHLMDVDNSEDMAPASSDPDLDCEPCFTRLLLSPA